MLGSCVTNFKGIGSAVLQKKFRELLRTQSTVEPQQLILYRPPASQLKGLKRLFGTLCILSCQLKGLKHFFGTQRILSLQCGNGANVLRTPYNLLNTIILMNPQCHIAAYHGAYHLRHIYGPKNTEYLSEYLFVLPNIPRKLHILPFVRVLQNGLVT